MRKTCQHGEKIGEFPVVPRAIVETSWNCRFCPPTRDGVMLRKALVFSQRSRSGFRLTHSELLASHDVLAMQSPGISGDVQLIWKKWKFGSSVQMGQGSTYPFQWKSMETIWEFTECPWCLKNCQRVRPPINPRSCVFHGDWFPLSACLRFAWVNAGLNVNMLVIVGYFTMLKVPFWILLITSPLFACSISVALGFCGIFSTICVCVSENRVTINHVNPQIYHKFLYFFMFKNWRILLGSFFSCFHVGFPGMIESWSSHVDHPYEKKHYRWLIYSNSGIIPQ